MLETLLFVENLKVVKGKRVILNVPELKLFPGQNMAVIGANGAGKSTLLRVMAGLESPTMGKVMLEGCLVTGPSSLEARRLTATVFQDSLLLNDNVFNNVSLGLKYRGLGREEVRKRVEESLERFGLSSLVRRQASSLSGGEAQRVSLARALALEPRVLFLDEPFHSLDMPGKASVLADLIRLLPETGTTLVMVSHDYNELPALAKRVVVLSQGSIIQYDTPREVFESPASIEVATLVGYENTVPCVVEIEGKGSLVKLLGGFEVGLSYQPSFQGDAIMVIRPEDVFLDRGPGSNSLMTIVRSVVPYGSQYRVEVNGNGFSLVALVGREKGLGLKLGQRVTMSLRPEGVRILSTGKREIPMLTSWKK